MVRFDISDLRIFVNVVQAGSITRGAERSHRAVASISTRIKEMEEELGTPLLMRNRAGVEPTEAGKKLLGHAYRLLKEVQRMNDDLDEYGNRTKNFVKLYSNTVGLYEYLQEPLSQFLKQNPAITLTIEEAVNDAIPSAVLDGRADIGVLAEPVDTANLVTLPLATDTYVIVTPPSWDHIAASRARFEQFLDHELVGPGRGTWMHTMLQQHAAEHGKGLRNSVQLRSFSLTCRMVASGVGIGIVPASAALRAQSYVNLRIIELEDAWANLPLKLCVRNQAGLSRHAAALLEFLAQGGGHALPTAVVQQRRPAASIPQG
jgi:DNA-binding transcriptional LysR family regulator